MAFKIDSKYDVVIVGGGPVGIYTSIQLAEAGFHVLVIEEDAQIGKPRFCTGLISKEAFDKFSLPKEAIEGKFNSAWVLSPLGSKAYLGTKDTQVYVTDRTAFDSGLYLQAIEAGVEFMLQCRCTELKINDDGAEARLSSDGAEATAKSEAVILSTGIKYNLHKDVGLTAPPDFLDCSQVQVQGKSEGEIEIFLGNGVAPHSFAWIVPLKENRLRVGVSTRKNSPHFLKTFLKELRSRGRINEENYGIIRRPIPLGAIKNTFASRVLVVGDAAGQVKPTTGGGIYFGLLCADLAVRTIKDAFKKKDFSSRFLRHYEINWKKEIEFDLTMGLYLRKLLTSCTDDQIEKMVQFCSQDSIQRLIKKHADFNHHGRFIKELIKRPAFWKSLYQILAPNK